MRRVPVVFLLSAFLFSSSALLNGEDLYHTVKNGDTVYSLSRRYGVAEKDLLSANGLRDARKIYVGQRLRIPHDEGVSGGTVQSGGTAELVDYRVHAGDTLYSIARRYGLTYKELLRLNKLPTNYVLLAGSVIKVPAPPAAPSPAVPLRMEKPRPKTPPAENATPAGVRKGAAFDVLQWPVTPKATAYMKGKLNGVVLTGEKTETVRSLTSGTVISAGPYRGFGRVVIVKSDRGYDYVYGGCESLSVRKWDRVLAGSEVGKWGIDSLSAKPQLFFMVYLNGKPVDPAKAPRGA
jgi:LysM repeat protein